MWHREHHRWWSPALERHMELLVLGHAGARVIAFPTSQGRFFEWEDRGMAGALGEHLRQGWVQLFCVDSVDAESWYAEGKHPGERAWRHEQYDRYLRDEVLPFTRSRNANPFAITAGASFGAYHAVNFALRHPEQVGRTIGMSGMFDIRRFTGGYSDQTVYHHNPVQYVPGEHDPWRLERLRGVDVILPTGADDRLRHEHDHLSHLLWEKGIGNALRIWDGWAHDWPWWQQMIARYIGGHD